MPYGVPQADWSVAKREALASLRRRATQVNSLITYSELVREIDAIGLKPDDHRLHHLLDEISREEHASGRGMLSVLVVHKQGEHEPGAGFFKLARELDYDFDNPESFFISELRRVQAANTGNPIQSSRLNLNGRKIESLPIEIPDYPGASHPISRGLPKFYRPESLKDSVEGKTNRTSVFEKIIVGLYLRLGRAVPYAFYTISEEIRSLDAGCIKFLLNRPSPEIELVTDNSGEIVAVRPLPTLVNRYRQMHASLLKEAKATSESLKLPFDINDPVDERRKVISNQVIREGAAIFRASVLANWSGRCAVTGTNVSRALQAAHIFSYLGPQTNSPFNGIALRADIHALFDAHLFSIRYDGANLMTCVSLAIRGTEYGKLADKQIRLPGGVANCPHPELVSFHFQRFADKESARKVKN